MKQPVHIGNDTYINGDIIISKEEYKLGNQEPYFSVTHITTRATKNHAIDKRCHWESIGACSSVEQKMFPDLNDIFDLNLKTFDYDNDYHRDIVRKYNLNICH